MIAQAPERTQLCRAPARIPWPAGRPKSNCRRANMTATATDRTSSRYWHDRAARVKPETGLFIDGRFVNAASGARFQTLNPATRQVLAEVAQGAAKDVDLAVAAAKNAFRSGRWSRIAPRARMDVLFKVARLLEQHADDLALLDCLDMGQPISELVNIDVPGSVV